MTDAAGEAVPSTAVWLRSAAGPAGELEGAADTQLWANDDGTFGMDFRKLQPPVGLYTCARGCLLSRLLLSMPAVSAVPLDAWPRQRRWAVPVAFTSPFSCRHGNRCTVNAFRTTA